jgi:hypothetical protein
MIALATAALALFAVLTGQINAQQPGCEDQYFTPNQQLSTATLVPDTPISGALCTSSGDFYRVRVTSQVAGFVVYTFTTRSNWSPDLSSFKFSFTEADSTAPVPLPNTFGGGDDYPPFPSAATNLTLQSLVVHPGGGSREFRTGLSNFWGVSYSYPYNLTVAFSLSIPPAFVATAAAPRVIVSGAPAVVAASSTGSVVFAIDVNANEELVIGFAARTNVTATVKGAGLDHAIGNGSVLRAVDISSPTTMAGRVIIEIKSVLPATFNVVSLIAKANRKCEPGADGVTDSDSPTAPRIVTLGQSISAAICRYSDIDYFRVNVPRPMAMKVQFVPAATGSPFVFTAKSLDTNATILQDSFSREETVSMLGVSTGATFQVQINPPSASNLLAPAGRFTIVLSEDQCPYSQALGYPDTLQRATAYPIDSVSFSTGFCTNQTAGEHWYVGEVTAPGWIFYLNTLSASSVLPNHSITLSLPDVSGAPSWSINSTVTSLRRQAYTGSTVGKVYVRVVRTPHAGAPAVPYTVNFGFYACNSSALPPTHVAAPLELGTPLTVRTCISTSGSVSSSPQQLMFRPASPGLFVLNVTSQRAPVESASVSLLANSSGISLTGSSVSKGKRAAAFAYMSIAAPTNFTVSGSSALGELSLTINSINCGENSNLFSAATLNSSTWLVATSIAAANTRRAQFQTVEMSGGYVRGLFCDDGVHYYALGVRNASISLQFSQIVPLGRDSLLGSAYLTTSTGAMLGSKPSIYSSSSTVQLTQSTPQSDDILLAIESSSPFFYVVGIVLSGCRVVDEPIRTLALDDRLTGNWCPSNDQDQFTFQVPSSGLYNVTVQLPLPLNGYVYISGALYTDATRTTLLSSQSCSLRDEGVNRTCQFALTPGNFTITTYMSSHVVYGYTISAKRVGACAVDTPPPGTTFAGAVAVAPDVVRSASFCPSMPDSHYFTLPPIVSAQATMTFEFESDSSPPSSSTDPLWRLDATLLDAQQRVVARIGSMPSAISTLPAVSVTPSARVLRVQRVNHTQPSTPPQTYSFQFSLYECVNDADEGTVDSLQFPRLLPLGDTNRLFSICPARDVDYFRFAVTAGAYVLRVGDKVQLAEPSRFSVRVYDEHSSELVTETRPSVTGIERLFLALDGEVVVSVTSSVLSDYDISLVRTTTQCLAADSPEESSTMAAPFDLGFLSPYEVESRSMTFCTARGPSTHFFSMRVVFDDVSFRLLTNESDGTLTLTFRLLNGTSVSIGANEPFRSLSNAVRQSIAFQVARTNPRSALQMYRVLVSSSECDIDPYDGSGYKQLPVPGALANLTACRNQNDRFRFELTDFEQVTITTTPAMQMSMYFRDADAGQPLVASGVGSVNVTNAPIGTYTLVVTDNTFSTSRVYSIDARLMKPRAPLPTPTRRLIVSSAPTPVPGSTPPPSPGSTSGTTTAAGPVCGNRVKETDEVCDGESCCAADCKSFKPATTECRAAQAALECDLPELCDGSSATCPTAERVRDTTHVCRASLGPCSDVTRCDGASTRCPAVALMPLDAPCDDGDAMCTSGDKCDANGQCVGKFTCDCRMAADPAKACDDKNDCTVDSCDGTGACVNTRAAAATKCTPPPAVLMAAMVCDSMPAFACTADGACVNSAADSSGNKTCPGEPMCSGRGVCCNGRCRCPAQFSGPDCGREIGGPDSNPNAKPVVVTFVDQKEALSGLGTATARVRLADGSSVVLQAGGSGTVTMGDEAIGVSGTGDGDQIEFPETLTISLDGRAFILRGLIFSDFSAERGDIATITMFGGSRRRAPPAPFNITSDDWRASDEDAPVVVTSFTIAPTMGGDGFGVLSVDMIDVSNGTTAMPTGTPAQEVPRGAPSDGDADTMMYIYIGVGAGAGLLCCILVIVAIWCVAKKKRDSGGEANSRNVPLASYRSESQLTEMPQAPVPMSRTQSVGVYASVNEVSERPSQYVTVPQSDGSQHDSYGTLSISSPPAPNSGGASQYLSPGEAGMYLAPANGGGSAQGQYLPLTSGRESMSSQEYRRPPAVGIYQELHS